MKKNSGFRMYEADRWKNLKEKLVSVQENGPEKKETFQSLASAFPSWTATTSYFEVLGVSEGASAEKIEASYRFILKKYHPDRFSGWGEFYEKRAHEIITLAQKARDELLKK